ncbi:MAG: chromate efflux transporter [Dehalococcoidia bacterium]
MQQAPGASPLREVAAVFLKLGTIAFGGPAAHIAMMRDEVVTRRRWLSDQQFLDLLGATNLIPGPNSTEMAIHLGYLRAGWRGLMVAGALFILPAFAIVLGFAWAYVRYGTTPEATWLLYGVKPVIIAIVVQALWGLRRAAVSGPLPAIVAMGVVAGYLLGVNEIALLFAGGLFALLARNAPRITARGVAVFAAPLAIAGSLPLAARAPDETPVSLLTLFLTCLKIGSVLYGSGYVLLAFLRNDFVVRLGWLTDQQLLDAVAVGQLTPGPVFTTATFVGYVVAGAPGAVLATIAIFLPSFVFVAAVNPLVARLRSSETFSALLDGVNAAALGLMAAVTWTLGRDAIVDWWTALLAAAAVFLLLRYRMQSVWLIVAGALAGVAHHYALS